MRKPSRTTTDTHYNTCYTIRDKTVLFVGQMVFFIKTNPLSSSLLLRPEKGSDCSWVLCDVRGAHAVSPVRGSRESGGLDLCRSRFLPCTCVSKRCKQRIEQWRGNLYRTVTRRTTNIVSKRGARDDRDVVGVTENSPLITTRSRSCASR